MQSVVFSLGGKSYAVDALAVQEILKVPNLTPLPQSPDFVMGVAVFRGISIPVIHLGKLLGVSSADDGARAIVLQGDGMCAAFMVDDVTDVLEIPNEVLDPISPAVSTADSAPIAVARLGGRLVIVVDPIKLLIYSR